MKGMKTHLINFFEPSPKAIRFLSYDESISKLAVLRADYSIEIWDIKETPFQEKIIPGDEKISVETLSWCNGRLFSGGLHGYVLEYDLNSLRSKSQILVTSGCPIWCMAVNKKKTHLAVGNEDGHVNLLEVSSEEINFDRKLDNQDSAILCLDWHKDGVVIATGSIDAIRTWDVNTGHVINRIMLSRVNKNVPTIVWCIAILSDMTLVSGDSSGKTSFWDGNTGALISSAGSKKGDILCLTVSKNEDIIYTSGVEPTIVSYMQSQSNGMWMKSVQRVVHTHDVRALKLVGDLLISGGDDCNLICTKYPPKIVLTFYPFCQKTYTSIAAEISCLLLQYSKYVELWKIGDQTSLNHLLRIKPKTNETIICSSISPNGKFIAYSTQYQLRLFSIILKAESSEPPSLAKVNLSDDIPQANILQFNKDSSKLICCVNSKIVIVNCDREFANIVCTLPPCSDSSVQIQIVALSDDDSYLACGLEDGNVLIYSLKNLKECCRLPRYKCQPSALVFDSLSTNVVVAYTDRKIIEYSIQKQAYTPWSKLEMLWNLKEASLYPFTSMCFSSDKLFILEENSVYVIDKGQQMAPAKKKVKQTEVSETMLTDNRFKTITKYEHISSMHSFNGELIIVQIPANHILDSLPPPIWKKIYGT